MSSVMRRVSLRNLLAHKVRLLLTALAVLLGTAFVAGSFVFTDTLSKTFDGLFDRTAAGVDVRVSPPDGPSDGVSEDVLDQLRAMPDVRAAQPAAWGEVVLLGADGAAVQSGGAPSRGWGYLPPEEAVREVDPYVQGQPPQADGQVGLNERAAAKAGLAVGDHARMVVPARGIVDADVTGIFSTGEATGGAISVNFTAAQARALFTDGGRFSSIDVAAAQGVSPDQLKAEIADALPDYRLKTGDELRADRRAELEQALNFINYFLLTFGAIALAVGTVIIYNTFSMLVAQRVRELALLRAIGASRGQISRSVLTEAIIVGLVGAVAGVFTGIGLAFGLRVLLNAFDVGLPQGPLAVEPRTFGFALLIGVVVTALSAYLPARRAGSVPPVAAMRDDASNAPGSLRTRTVVGAVVLVAGLAALIGGSFGTTKRDMIVVGSGAGGVLLAVLLIAPALSMPWMRAARVVTRPFGTVGRLAQQNGLRNPRRTAATAFALTLGLMLVSLIAVLGASAKSSVNALVDTGIRADFILTGPGQMGVPQGVEAAASRVAGVDRTVAIRPFRNNVEGEALQGISFDAPADGLIDQSLNSGSLELDGTSVLVSQALADERGWQVGSEFPVRTLRQEDASVRVAGIFGGGEVLGSVIASDELYRQVMPQFGIPQIAVLVKTAPGADQAEVRSALESATKQFVVVQVLDRDGFKSEQAQQIDQMLAILYGLLALAVVIAILGIVNTLALAVVERRREIGMLRAIGMARAQIRRMIDLEAVLIAVFGAVLGVVLGVGFGRAFIFVLREQGLSEFTVPWGQVIAMLIGSGVVGVLAALWPAARAARTEPLEAISEA